MKNKKRTFGILWILIFLTFVSTAWSNISPEALWAKSVVSGSSDSRFHSLIVDSNGNIYASGDIKGSDAYDFGNGVTVNGSYSDDSNVVLVKYDSSGNAQWAKSVTSGSSESQFRSVAIDSSGNIYASGFISGTSTYDFGNGVTVSGPLSTTSRNVVLVKYDSSGNAQWAKSVGGSSNSNSEFVSVAVDSSGNVYVSGYVVGSNTYDFGNGVTVNGSYSYKNVVLVKYNSSGNALWAKSVTSGSNSSKFDSVTVDDNGNIYTSGYIHGTSTYDFSNVVTVGGSYDSGNNGVLVKYDSSGEAQWAKSVVSGSSDSEFRSVAIDSNGNIYATGDIKGSDTYDFNNGITINGPSDSNVVLVKYDSSGNALWAKSVVSSLKNSFFGSVAIDSSGNIYASGYIYGTSTYDFGNGVTVGPCSYSSGVLVKYDSNGEAQWAKSITTGPNYSYFMFVTTDSNGNIYVSGNICGSGEFNFGNEVTVSGPSSGLNIALVKYLKNNASKAPVIKTTSTTSSYNFCGAIVIDDKLEVTDADSSSIQSAKVTLSNPALFEFLEFTDQNGITGKYNAKTGELTLTGSASVADYQTALRSIKYKNDKSSSKEVTVSFVVNDGDNDSNIATRKISVEQRDCIDDNDDDSSSSTTTSQIGILSAIGAGLALIF